MEDTTKPETKKSCYCGAAIGVVVIALAWWQPSWGAIALTLLGAMLIIRDIRGKCSCTSICETKK